MPESAQVAGAGVASASAKATSKSKQHPMNRNHRRPRRSHLNRYGVLYFSLRICLPALVLKACTTPDKRDTKRLADTLDRDLDTVRKRPRRHPIDPLVDETSGRLDPVGIWARDGQWPREYFEPEMEHILARKRSLFPRKRSNSATSTTPSDQRPREEKSAPYRDPRYKTLLATKGSYMDEFDVGITEESKTTYYALLSSQQKTPNNSLFQDDLFKRTCRKVEDRNEARVIRDITPLVVPSAEILCIYGAKHLDILIESINEGWNNSIPLTGTRPQPDYSVGFKREAFTDSQLAKLSPCLGDFIAGDQSFFMATYYMYFPFLTCEVKYGAAALDIADRQNAHSMTLAVRAIVKLFRAVERQDEVNRQILAFSISHDHQSVRIYGHYAVIDEKDAKYYRHPIRNFVFTELDGKEKWTAYQFIRNVYDIWMPIHFKRICSAIDQLPSELDFDVLSQPGTGLSQDLKSLMQPGVGSVSPPVNQGSQSSNVGKGQATTPGTFAGPEKGSVSEPSAE